MTVIATSPRFKENAARALADAPLQSALAKVKRGFIDKRAAAAARAAGVRGAARRGARHQGPHARPSRPLPRGLRGEGDGVGRRGAFRPHRRGGARDHPVDLPRGRGAHRHQGQVDDRRGDRAEQPSRGGRHHAGRDRPRRVHHPAPRRDALATSSRPRCMSPRRRSSRTSGACTRRSTRGATCPSR